MVSWWHHTSQGKCGMTVFLTAIAALPLIFGFLEFCWHCYHYAGLLAKGGYMVHVKDWHLRFNLCTHGLFVMQVHTLNLNTLNYLSQLCTSGLDSGRSLCMRLHQGKFTWPLWYIPNSQDFFCSCSWEHVWPARPRETLSDSAGSVLQLYSALL